MLIFTIRLNINTAASAKKDEKRAEQDKKQAVMQFYQ